MSRLRSIRVRVFAGFLALLVLQLGMASAVWIAQRRVDEVAVATRDATLKAARLSRLSGLLTTAQLRLSDYLRSGGTPEREAVQSALGGMIDALPRAEPASGKASSPAAAPPAREIADLRLALDGVLEAVAQRRMAADAVQETMIEIENGAASLARVLAAAPERETADAGAAALAAIGPSLTASGRYAMGERAVDETVARSTIARARQTISAIGASSPKAPPRLVRATDALTKSLNDLEPELTRLTAAIAERGRRLRAVDDAASAANAAVGSLNAAITAEQDSRLRDSDRARAAMMSTVMLASAVACALGLSLAVLVGLSITRPIGRLSQAMRRIAAGALDSPVPDCARRDEVGGMAVALLSLRDASAKARSLEAEAAEQEARLGLERDRREALQRAAAEQQAEVVRGLAAGLASLAAGDLTRRLEQPFPPEYEQLRHDFNAAMVELHGALEVVVGNTAGLRHGSGEISHAADDLSRRTEQQAANLEETAAALDEITATVARTSEGAGQARQAVFAAKDEATASAKVMDQARAAMDAIEQSARQIGQITAVIDEIAFQTNLLALNAGVEAARAGDSGRGFAVVASEVRILAQRSAGAAREIKALISNSSRQVGEGVALVASTGQSLSRIMGRVEQVSALVVEIAASAQEQASGLANVNAAVNQMDQITQQNAAMVEQSTAASHTLTRETEELVRLTSRFRIAPGARNDAGPLAPPQGAIAA